MALKDDCYVASCSFTYTDTLNKYTEINLLWLKLWYGSQILYYLSPSTVMQCSAYCAIPPLCHFKWLLQCLHLRSDSSKLTCLYHQQQLGNSVDAVVTLKNQPPPADNLTEIGDHRAVVDIKKYFECLRLYWTAAQCIHTGRRATYMG